MELTREVYAGVYPLRFTLMESFKCSSVNCVLSLDCMTFMSEKATTQGMLTQTKQTFSELLLGERSHIFLALLGSRNAQRKKIFADV